MNQDFKKLILFSLVLTIFNFSLFILYYTPKWNNSFIKNHYKNDLSQIPQIINEPFLPLYFEDYPYKNYSRINYNSSNIRYHFDEFYKQRKLFKINYSYLPYEKVKKYNSYEQAADYIFESTGMLNITLLNYYYHNINIDISKFNHIHIGMCFDANYIILSKISIASILNTSSADTFIHFHIGLNGCKFSDIKSLLDLKRINKNIEFIFYKGTQAEYDFCNKGSKTFRGIGDYTRVLLPQIVNNTNKILILDSGDIIVQKDLSELYFFDIGKNYFVFSLEFGAGNFNSHYIFHRNNFYPNTGVCLVNVRKFREDNLYKIAFYSAIAYDHLPCPYQDIFLMISNYKFKYWPLNYNAPQFFESNEEMSEKKIRNSSFKRWLLSQKKSPFKYDRDELVSAALNPVILHLYYNKPYTNRANKKNTKMWLDYAKLANVFDIIKMKYPKIFIKMKFK